MSQTDSWDSLVGSSEGNPEHCVPMVQQCDPSAEHRCLGMFPSVAGEVAVVETLSLRCVQGVRGRETLPNL